MNWFDFLNPFHNEFLEADRRYEQRMSHHNCYNKRETDDMIKCMAPLIRHFHTQDIIDLLPADGNEMIKVADLRKQLSEIRGNEEDEARKFRSFNQLWQMFVKARG